MQKLFLSYTYRPHPAHEDSLDRLHKAVSKVIESMGLRVVDGVNVGGKPLDQALKDYITDADALVALVTPQADDANAEVQPAFVLSEFQFADALQKPTMRVLHQALPVPPGLGAANEYTPYAPGPGGELAVAFKLVHTIALWKRQYGCSARVRIEPKDLAVGYDETDGDKCECQVITSLGQYGQYTKAQLQMEPGAAYALLPKLREGDRVRLRLRKGGQTWRAEDAIDPFVGGVVLEKQP